MYKSKCLASRFSHLQGFSAKDKTTCHVTLSVWTEREKNEEKDSQKRDANRNKVHERARWNKDVGTVIALAEERGVHSDPPSPLPAASYTGAEF